MATPRTPKPDTTSAVVPATETPTVVAGYVFEDVEVVKAAREPNPFDAVVATLVVGSDKGKAFVIPGTDDMDAKRQYTNKTLRTVRRQLTDAGDAITPPVTVRMVTHTAPDKTTTRVEIKAIKKILKGK